MLKKNWTSQKAREAFLDFFKEKGHEIVPSAPMVLQNDPTLMFTNAGMNQFKDYFLGYREPVHLRVADTQKCLRVSGKHNDLEDVGKDTYHHTMFEMLGNWSFGDYYKEKAIAWAWELLTEVFEISKERIYVTIFQGDEDQNLDRDQEAYNFWKNWIDEERILDGDKKDNFWEMGDTGPCGPCSEIHVDIRADEERLKVDGKQLVNQDHPQVVEIWNLVFIQYNRLANGSLETLKNQFIDTGMGFERLCMILQNSLSNYDTDLFQPIISKVEKLSNIGYQSSMTETDIAIRVIVDHIRAIAFAIADGQLPSNTGAGYVIRRILRRAVRYGYSFLNLGEPFMFQLIEPLVMKMGEAFPELKQQKTFIEKVIYEEEQSFLRTLESGLRKLSELSGDVDGKQAFELYDTYGFPFDLTQLIAREKGFKVDEHGFAEEMKKQKDRSRQDAKVETGDWVILHEGESEFVGYDQLETDVKVNRYRTIHQKNKEIYQIVLNETPFYAEAGGQVGDKGILSFGNETIPVYDTKKEGNLIIHYVKSLPQTIHSNGFAKVDIGKRRSTELNHTATHLLHAALRKVLGNHVQQKGSLVSPEKLRFDFSHFSKLTDVELKEIEEIVNQKIGQNIQKTEERNASLQEALNRGAMALFGEKYGDSVRVITFDPDFSVELCGGTHVASTAQIRLFKIINESASAAGIRRIEAITGDEALTYYQNRDETVHELAELMKSNKNLVETIEKLIQDNKVLQGKMENFYAEKAQQTKKLLKEKIENIDGIQFIGEIVELENADSLKNLAFELKNEVDNLFFIGGCVINEKPLLTIMISENIVNEKNLNAGAMIRELAKEIKGGGGGQAFYATAGGSDVTGLDDAIVMGKQLITNL